MKKILVTAMSLAALTAGAQTKGRIEIYDFDNFKVHVYYTNDVMADASYIIEGKDALVTMEQPLFKENVAEFDAYLASLGKPVEKRVTDYHVGGTGDHDIVMAEGMPEFSKGEIYGGMMAGFAQAFGDAMTDLPTGSTSEVAFGSTQTFAGVTFEFRHGASTDFPAASILIGGKVYYTHWAPAKMHISPLQVSSRAAIAAEIAEAKASLASGAELFIGGHCGAATTEAVNFKIEYLTTLNSLLDECTTADAFIAAVRTRYPDLPAEDNLTALAAALYK